MLKSLGRSWSTQQLHKIGVEQSCYSTLCQLNLTSSRRIYSRVFKPAPYMQHRCKIQIHGAPITYDVQFESVDALAAAITHASVPKLACDAEWRDSRVL